MQFVDEEDCGVAVIKNQWMTERRRLGDIGLVTGEAVEEAFVEAKGLVEVRANLFTFFSQGRRRRDDRS